MNAADKLSRIVSCDTLCISEDKFYYDYYQYIDGDNVDMLCDMMAYDGRAVAAAVAEKLLVSLVCEPDGWDIFATVWYRLESERRQAFWEHLLALRHKGVNFD